MLSVLDDESAETPAAAYERLHACEVRLRVPFELVNKELAPWFIASLGMLVYFNLLFSISALLSSDAIYRNVALCSIFTLFMGYMVATLAEPAERWFQMRRDIDTPRTCLPSS